MALGTSLPARIPACSEAATIYISPSGSDSTGDGSIGNPYKSPDKAFDMVALTGGLILCRGGSYGTLGQQRWDRNGNAADPVQIRAYPAETPVFDGVTSWRIVGSYLRVGPGLGWVPSSNSGDNNIAWLNGCHHVEIVGNAIINSTSGVQPSSNQGILITVTGRVDIYDNEFVGNGAGQNQTHCIYLSSASPSQPVVIANNVFRDGAAGYGIQLYPNADGAIVVCNTLDGWTNRSAIVIGGDGSNTSTGLVLVGNIVSGSVAGRNAINVNWESAAGSGQVSDSIGYDNAGGDYETADPGVTWTNNLTATNPLYDNRAGNDFHITDDGSPAKALVPAAREGYVPVLDKDGNSRGSADAGAYAVGTGSPPPPPDQPPVNVTAPHVSGSPVEGQTLATTNGTWDNDPTSFAYQWQRCNAGGGSCVDIGSATSATYLLVSADVGSTIRVRVTATNAEGSTPAFSQVTAVIGGSGGGAGPPVNTVAPSISGIAQEGQTLTAGAGTWTGDTPMTFAYQWRRCDAAGGNCVDISGSASATRLLTGADVGSTMRVRVTATN